MTPPQKSLAIIRARVRLEGQPGATPDMLARLLGALLADELGREHTRLRAYAYHDVTDGDMPETPPHAPTLAALIHDGLKEYAALFVAPMVPSALDSLEVANWLASWLEEYGWARVASPAAPPPEPSAALEEIAAKDGLCIYGCHEMVERFPDRAERDQYGEWFRMGSALAFAECAAIAKTALGAGSPQTPEPR